MKTVSIEKPPTYEQVMEQEVIEPLRIHTRYTKMLEKRRQAALREAERLLANTDPIHNNDQKKYRVLVKRFIFCVGRACWDGLPSCGIPQLGENDDARRQVIVDELAKRGVIDIWTVKEWIDRAVTWRPLPKDIKPKREYKYGDGNKERKFTALRKIYDHCKKIFNTKDLQPKADHLKKLFGGEGRVIKKRIAIVWSFFSLNGTEISFEDALEAGLKDCSTQTCSTQTCSTQTCSTQTCSTQDEKPKFNKTKKPTKPAANDSSDTCSTSEDLISQSGTASSSESGSCKFQKAEQLGHLANLQDLGLSSSVLDLRDQNYSTRSCNLISTPVEQVKEKTQPNTPVTKGPQIQWDENGDVDIRVFMEPIDYTPESWKRLKLARLDLHEKRGYADYRHCGDCDAKIVYVKVNGQNMPVDFDGPDYQLMGEDFDDKYHRRHNCDQNEEAHPVRGNVVELDSRRANSY